MQFTSPGPQIGAVIPGKGRVTSASFHEGGRYLYVASDSNKLSVIDCKLGKASGPPFKFEREGVSLVEATHHDQCIIVAGKGSPDQPLSNRYAVNYHSVHDNKILRKFRGHSDMVNKVSMNPTDDSFLTSSQDRTVRLWNVQQPGAVAQLELPQQTQGDPYAAFDSTGLVFGIYAAMTGGQGNYIHLYDARNYSGGAFAEMKVTTAMLEKTVTHKQARSDWTSMAFNASGNQILITGKNGLCVTLDGYEGTLQRSLSSPGASSACWSSDDKSVLVGNEDGSISCWNVDTGAMIRKLEGHTGTVSWLGVNPKSSMFASCDTNVALWIW